MPGTIIAMQKIWQILCIDGNRPEYFLTLFESLRYVYIFQIILENKWKRAESIQENPQRKRREIMEIFVKTTIHKYRKEIKLKYI